MEFLGQPVRLGSNFRSRSTEARRIQGEYVKVKQGKHTVVLTENQLRKLAKRFA